MRLRYRSRTWLCVLSLWSFLIRTERVSVQLLSIYEVDSESTQRTVNVSSNLLTLPLFGLLSNPAKRSPDFGLFVVWSRSWSMTKKFLIPVSHTDTLRLSYRETAPFSPTKTDTTYKLILCTTFYLCQVFLCSWSSLFCLSSFRNCLTVLCLVDIKETDNEFTPTNKY